jgi:hypothetical protein
MVRDDHAGCSEEGGFLEHRQQFFRTGSDQDGSNHFCVRERIQLGGLDNSHGSRSDSEDRVTSREWKYLPR